MHCTRMNASLRLRCTRKTKKEGWQRCLSRTGDRYHLPHVRVWVVQILFLGDCSNKEMGLLQFGNHLLLSLSLLFIPGPSCPYFPLPPVSLTHHLASPIARLAATLEYPAVLSSRYTLYLPTTYHDATSHNCSSRLSTSHRPRRLASRWLSPSPSLRPCKEVISRHSCRHVQIGG